MARKRPKKLGNIRQSQALLTFGIGAVVDFQYHSAMPLGLEHWPEKEDCPRIHEPDLEAILGREWFQAPPVENEQGNAERLRAARFPQWLYCPKCQALGLVREVYTNQQTKPDFGPQFAFTSTDGGRPECTRCAVRKPPGIGVPTRLVAVCFHDQPTLPEPEHPGHIDDFPWFRWAHQKKELKDTEIHALRLISSGGSLAIDDLAVTCTCGARESLRGAFAKDSLRGIASCKGWRPWLESRIDGSGCDRPLRVFQRGATNLHLPVSQTVISIPPHTSELAEQLDRHIDDLRGVWEERCEDAAENNEPKPDLSQFVARQLKRKREQGFDRDGQFADVDCHAALMSRLSGITNAGSDDRTSAAGRRYAECQAIRQGEINPRGNFDAHPVAAPPGWEKYFCRVVMIHRLREVTALQGFRRISRDNPDQITPENRYAKLSVSPQPWLPAVELRGEGIFLEFDRGALSDWELKKQDAIGERLAPLLKNYGVMAESEGWENPVPPSPRFVLIHTLAHLLIRQLTLECGYSSAALRERLYVSTGAQEMAGLLIYTSTPDADGSLGGLVRMGLPERLGPVLRDALRHAAWCSSDPICTTVHSQGYRGLNRAACHACVLVPETSCEGSNRMLDRALLIPSRGTVADAAFFSASLAESSS